MVKKQSFYAIVILFASITGGYPHQSIVDTCFSPSNNCTEKISQIIRKAKNRVYVHSYSFTSKDLCNELIDAYKRGVDVKVYIDKGRAKEPHSRVKDLEVVGIPVIIQRSKYLAHNKIMVIDDDTVITGSFNWTDNAKKNEENVLVVKSKGVAQKYIENWESITKK